MASATSTLLDHDGYGYGSGYGGGGDHDGGDPEPGDLEAVGKSKQCSSLNMICSKMEWASKLWAKEIVSLFSISLVVVEMPNPPPCISAVDSCCIFAFLLENLVASLVEQQNWARRASEILMMLTMLMMLMMLMRPTQVNALAVRRRETRLLAGKRLRWVGSPLASSS